MIELSLFAITLTLYRSKLDWARMATYFLLVALVITAFNIWWHVSHGYYFGWKRLNAPKFLFSYGIPVLFSVLLLNSRRAGLLDYLCLAAVGFLLVLSGERKAQIGFLICLLILVAVGYVRIGPILLGGWLSVLLLSSVIASSPYLSSQLHSLSTLGEAANATIGELKAPDPDLSLSNAQRAFASRVSAELIGQNPLWGIGTNAYLPYVRSVYSDYPKYLVIAIHNEFQRILVENGAVGLFFYLLPWLRSATYGALFYARTGSRAAAMYAMFYIIILLQCFFEGGGSEAFIAFIAMALLPDFFLTSGVLERLSVGKFRRVTAPRFSNGPRQEPITMRAS